MYDLLAKNMRFSSFLFTQPDLKPSQGDLLYESRCQKLQTVD